MENLKKALQLSELTLEQLAKKQQVVNFTTNR